MEPTDDFDYRRDALPERRRGTPRVLDAYYVLRDRSLADRLHVVEALRDPEHRLGDPRPDDKSLPARCERAYIAYVNECGTTSGRGYVEWWKDHPDPDSIPTPPQIRWHLGRGSWVRVAADYGVKAGGKQRCHLSARELTAIGPFFDKTELRAVLRAYAQDTEGWLSQSDLIGRWIPERIAENDPRFKRLPQSQNPFDRIYSTFKEALADVGVEHRHSSHAPRQRVRRRCDAGIPQYTAEQAGPFVRAAVEELGTNITAVSYRAWASRERHRLRAAGDENPQVPGSRGAQRAFEATTFIEMLFKAGCISMEEAIMRTRYGVKYSRRDLYVALADAMHNVRERLGIGGYDARRERLCLAAAKEGVLLPLPCGELIAARLGDRNMRAARKATQEWMAETGYQPKDDPA